MTKHFSGKKSLNLLLDEESLSEDILKTSQKKAMGMVEFWTDSDDENIVELEGAVKQYKKNIKKNESDQKLGYEKAKVEIEKNKKSQSLNTFKRRKKILKEEKKFEENISGKVNSNEEVSSDVQELIHYFFLNMKVKNEKAKSYAEYEKQGAIPKRLVMNGKSSERSKNRNTEVDLESKKDNSKQIHKSFQDHGQTKIKKKNFEKYNVMKKSNSDDVIVEINEEICSKPFFYIVPENPSPNFFLPRGSYLVIPKTPDAVSESKIIFHPENMKKSDLNDSGLSPEVNFRGVTLDYESSVAQDSRVSTNNLGREVLTKMDSHLNIGPTDVKLNDCKNNLETNYDLNKVFDKSFLKDSSSEPQEEDQDLEQSEKIIGFGKYIIPDVQELTKAEGVNLDLLENFSDLDVDSGNIIEDEYLFDEAGIRNNTTSGDLKRKMIQQLETMCLALPEKSFEELREKCIEFQGEEKLVAQYIQEAQQADEIRQRILDIQFVLPDADPDFLRHEVEKLSGDGQEFNILIDELLDSKNYPKISVDPLREERKRLWQMYVENFDVKNFILKNSNPGDFAGAAGDNNKADEKLVLEFLKSRYPLQNSVVLIETFLSNNRNVTKTCDAFKNIPVIRLAESSFQNAAFDEAFLEEVCYIDHRKEIDDHLKELKERKEIETEEARLNNAFLFCPLCSDDEVVASEALCCSEGHIFCKNCIKRKKRNKEKKGMTWAGGSPPAKFVHLGHSENGPNPCDSRLARKYQVCALFCKHASRRSYLFHVFEF